MHTPTSITAWWGVPECTRCVKDSRLQEESDVHSQASVTSITRTPWIVDTLSSFDAFGRQCDSGKHLWKNENRSHCRRMETFPIVFSVESEWNVAGGREVLWNDRPYIRQGRTFYRCGAKRARDFTEFVLFIVVRFPKKKVSMMAYEGIFIIFAPLVISSSPSSNIFFGTRFLSRHAGHLIILAAG